MRDARRVGAVDALLRQVARVRIGDLGRAQSSRRPGRSAAAPRRGTRGPSLRCNAAAVAAVVRTSFLQAGLNVALLTARATRATRTTRRARAARVPRKRSSSSRSEPEGQPVRKKPAVASRTKLRETFRRVSRRASITHARCIEIESAAARTATSECLIKSSLKCVLPP